MDRKSMIRAIMKMLEEMEDDRVRTVWFFVRGMQGHLIRPSATFPSRGRR